jgi:hypothetical protein
VPAAFANRLTTVNGPESVSAHARIGRGDSGSGRSSTQRSLKPRPMWPRRATFREFVERYTPEEIPHGNASTQSDEAPDAYEAE